MKLLRAHMTDVGNWGGAFLIAATAHAAVAASVVTWVKTVEPVVADPIVLVDLSALSDEPTATPVEKLPEPQKAPPAPKVTPPKPVDVVEIKPVDAPKLKMPAPDNAVILPEALEKPELDAKPIEEMEATPVNLAENQNPAPLAPVKLNPGEERRAKKAAANYFATLSAWLSRHKVYPVEAKQARQQGTVIIRFTLDRNGNVSGEAIKTSSGYQLLDAATLDLLRWASPMPAMPDAMRRDRLTLSLPIEYSLKTD